MKKIQMISANEYQTSERFYALPKIFFESDYYKEMRLDTKVAYSVLKDRLALSLKNNWIDESGYIYLMYSNSKLMEILSCSKATLLRIKKQLNEYGLILEIQQSTSKSGSIANRIYLGQLQNNPTVRNVENTDDSSFETRGVSNLDRGGVKFRPGGSQIETGGVSNLAPNDTEYSDTNISDTKLIISEDEEEKATQNPEEKIPSVISKKVDKATKYDREYIYSLVHDQLLKENFSQTAADYAMIHFDNRYKYALKNMRYAHSSEMIAEYVFNGILADVNQSIRQEQNKGFD